MTSDANWAQTKPHNDPDSHASAIFIYPITTKVTKLYLLQLVENSREQMQEPRTPLADPSLPKLSADHQLPLPS